jgi:UDP-glucuronate 4-epimerase
MNFLVTGAAGFIGFHTSRALLSEGHTVVGLDNLNEYYDPTLKQSRLDQLQSEDQFSFIKEDIAQGEAVDSIISTGEFDRVIHLAAQAGVRYSIDNPSAYVQSNLVGFGNLLEACRKAEIAHLIYASSSSVYGANTRIPFSEHDNANHPVSFYAATKRSNELMAHSYSSLYGLPTTGLRFFTAYGPWGRPDMALFKFTKAILNDEPIEVFNYGDHQRDFTYIDDIIEGVTKVSMSVPVANSKWDGEIPDPSTSRAPYRIYNIGNTNSVRLGDFIDALERKLGKKATRQELPLQPGDVPNTWADCVDLEQEFNYRPQTSIEEGISKFVDWYLEHYRG